MIMDCLMWLFIWSMIGIVVALAWAQRFTQEPVNPWLVTVLFVLVSIYLAWRFWRLLKDLRTYDLGLIGERHMGQMLEELRKDGYCPIHDVMLERMNIDHVLVGPGGVFTVETKMLRKTRGVQPTITRTRDGIVINSCQHVEDKPTWQAETEAKSLQDVLKRMGAQCPRIQPIVVYPGWFVTDDFPGAVWVLNDKYLLEKIRRMPVILPPTQVAALRASVEYYARETIEREDYVS